MSRRWAARVVLALVLVVVGAACRLDVQVGVNVQADGSGTVTVGVGADDELLAKAPGALAALRLDDLLAGGWSVVGPAKEPDGRTWVRATKAFRTPAEAEAVIAEVNGANGPLRNVRISAARNAQRTVWSFTGTAQLEGGLAAFSDGALTAALGGQPGLSAAVAAGGVPLDQALHLQVAVVLPGTMAAQAPGKVVDGRATWLAPMDGTVTAMAATGDEAAAGVRAPTSGPSWATWALGAYVVALLVAAVVVVLLVRRSVHRRSRRPSASPPPYPRGGPAPADPAQLDDGGS